MSKNKIPDEILLEVTKPARYTGNEINMVKKDLGKIEIRFAFCFPDVYEIGMSHLGLQILYYFLNRREDTYCERVFAPWVDLEEKMRLFQIPLFALESQDEVKKFDFVGFTLQYEMSYTNIVNMLDLAGIPVFREDRSEEDPIILCGGSCAYNPEPLADIVDFFYLGEGEVLYDELLDLYKQYKKEGKSKSEYLEALLEYDGIYVPKYYDVEYKETGEIKSFTPNHPKARKTMTKMVVKDFDQIFFPDRQLVPLIEVVHDRTTLELFRGCTRGCRFCQAGFVYRPVREKKASTLLKQAECLIDNSGHDEISLVSLSTSDYTEFKELSEGLLERFHDKGVNISLPSLRIDAFSLEVMDKVNQLKKSSLTFAPEAGSQRLRDVINKNLTEDEILSGLKLSFAGGYTRVKLYFMIGLPTETDEDLKGIGELCEKIAKCYTEYASSKRPLNMLVSCSCFVPKAFTPFQWEEQVTEEEFYRRALLVKDSIMRKKQIKVSHHDTRVSFLEGVLARGDRRIGKVIYRAWQLGASFDSWSEMFSYNTWLKAFSDMGVDPAFYANRERGIDEILPWDHISVGVSKEFLKEERAKAMLAQTTPNCREKCSNCGAASFMGGVCYEN